MKICKSCKKEKNINCFYRHPQMKDGHLNKCIGCAKRQARNNKPISFKCLECGENGHTNQTEIKRGGGKTCSRKCFYKYLKKVVKKGEQSPNWKGNKVGKKALHQWVIKHRGRPMKCEHCNSTTAKKYEWSNISQKYKRDLSDWQRLCTQCHANYDKETRVKKWRKSVKKYGWKV